MIESVSEGLFRLKKLDYALGALSPVMSETTLQFHYGKHHQGYVNKLNELLSNHEWKGKSLEFLVKNASGSLFNQAAQVWNHDFFWDQFRPFSVSLKEQGAASVLRKEAPRLAQELEKTWGSLEAFFKNFQDKGLQTFGSGWVWLVQDEEQGTLSLISTSNAETPLKQGGRPLLTGDVWEHAYYLDYQNDRGRYLGSLWDLFHWEKIQSWMYPVK